MKEDLLKIIEHYRIIPQLKYFQSEVFELNEAILTRELHWGYDIEVQDIGPLDKHIAEEIADVLVMLGQFINYYNISKENIEEIMKSKIERQLRRIEDERKNNNK